MVSDSCVFYWHVTALFSDISRQLYCLTVSHSCCICWFLKPVLSDGFWRLQLMLVSDSFGFVGFGQLWFLLVAYAFFVSCSFCRFLTALTALASNSCDFCWLPTALSSDNFWQLCFMTASDSCSLWQLCLLTFFCWFLTAVFFSSAARYPPAETPALGPCCAWTPSRGRWLVCTSVRLKTASASQASPPSVCTWNVSPEYRWDRRTCISFGLSCLDTMAQHLGPAVPRNRRCN